ncbi:MAG: adhesin [Bacteroidaceae bacterium]|nr:adhesin [Bacteroidaceae bacterium]
MNLKKYIYVGALGAFALTVASCYNADQDFPDYEGGTTAYFAYQFPVRTLVLGNDIYDNSLDQAHKCRIWSTMGGAYGGRDAVVEIGVADSLCDNLWFVDDGGNPSIPVRPMPSNYYRLLADNIPYNGDARGYVEVQFTDDFFSDSAAIQNTYVIPLLMKSVRGIDRILTGSPREGLTPARTNTEDWDVLAKDYVLYCVKYMNPWQGKYIRRGVDNVTENDVTTTVVRKDFSLVNSDLEHYKENPVNQNDEICGITTKNMTQAIFPVSINIGKDASGDARPSQICNLILTFDGDQCTITTEDTDATSSGSGEFIVKGTEKPEYKDYQWGSINGEPVQRDILRLAYNVNFPKGRVIGKKEVVQNGKKVEVDWVLENDVQISTADTLVVQTRESNKKEFYSPKYVKQ